MAIKVLVFCPTYPGFPHVWASTVRSIFALAWPEPLTITFERSTVKPIDGMDELTAKFNTARRFVLDGNYDALLSVKADMIVPIDALQKLAGVEADIARGLYVSRHEDRQWYAYTEMHGDGEGQTLSDKPQAAREAWG